MGDRFTTIRSDIGTKLRTARKAAQLSTRAVAEKLKGRFAVSHATVANYETGRSVPPVDVLEALAVMYERPSSWFLEANWSLSGVKYRNLKSKVRVADRHSYEAAAQRWLEAYVKLELRLERPLKRHVEFTCSPDDNDATLANNLRKALGITSDDPVGSVIRSLEKLGIRTLELPTNIAIDGLAARYRDEHVVVLNPTTANDRCRLNAAHELAHVILGDCETSDSSKQIEQRAFSVASHFLLPEKRLREAFNGRSLVKMAVYKEHFGISLAAMVYRAQQSRIISQAVAKRLWIEFSNRGWRLKEPGYVRPDRAIRFEDMLDGAIQSKEMSWKEAETLLGFPATELRHRLKLAMGITEVERAQEGSDDAPQALKMFDE
jgi:Zn-dependent peptidase ImmA (M78 family)